MFEHELFDKYALKDVPCDRDIYLMDEKWSEEYETAMLRTFAGESGDSASVGYISYAAARKTDEYGIDLSWYPNIYDRFHEVRIRLPKSKFIICVGCWQYDERPRIFVKGGWLDYLHVRPFSTFAFVDAIGVKNALTRERFDKEALFDLRSRIDRIAKEYPEVSFVSFGDTVILKSNWTVGAFDNDATYTYEPEKVLRVIPEIAGAFKSVLGLNIYAIGTQGANEYYDSAPMHISHEGNHVCMNSMGVPFAQLLAIDGAVKNALAGARHGPAELYLDAQLFNSLRFEFEFKKADHPKYAYSPPMSNADNYYYATDLTTVLGNIKAGVGRLRGK